MVGIQALLVSTSLPSCVRGVKLVTWLYTVVFVLALYALVISSTRLAAQGTVFLFTNIYVWLCVHIDIYIYIYAAFTSLM